MRSKSTVVALFLAVASFLLYAFRIDSSLIYHPDFARDLYEILKISQGNLTLLGPKLSFGGLYSGPYYFYLFVPVFILSGFNMVAVPLFNALLFSCALGYFAKVTMEKYSIWKGSVATLSLSLITITVYAARSPNNATAYLALLLVLLTIIQFKKIDRLLTLSVLGFIFGVILNFTFATLTLLPSILIAIYTRLSHKRGILVFLMGMVVAFLPLVFFEVKNNFIILKNTFINKSYLAWIDNQNVTKGVGGQKNIFTNLVFITGRGEMQLSLGLSPMFIYALMVLVYFVEKRSIQKLLLTNSLLALGIVTFFTRYQFAHHYLYPVTFFIFFNLIVFLLESRFTYLLIPIVFILILLFPGRLYKPSTVPFEPFDRAVRYSIKNKLVDRDSVFNVAYIADPNAILGYEFRYFFQKYGYPPLPEFEYAQSDILLLFTQKKNFDPALHNTWETQQFGRAHLRDSQKYQVSSFTIYKAQK